MSAIGGGPVGAAPVDTAPVDTAPVGTGPIDTDVIVDRIARSYGVLSPQEQRVADFLRDRPGESAFYNSSELARRTGVSKATVSRLYRRLGFADSREARESLRARRGVGVPVVVPSEGDPLGTQLERDIRNLRSAYAALDGATVDEVAAAVAGAGRVIVLGFRSAYPVAHHLRAQLAQVRADVALAPEPGQSLGEDLADLTAADVVVLVGLRRRPERFGAVAGWLVESPARVAVIGEPGLRVPGADWSFEVPIESASPFDSFAAVTSLVSVLAGAVLRAAATGAAHVSAVDRAYAGLGELEGL